MDKKSPRSDPNLPKLIDDPRILNNSEKGKAQKQRGTGRNTESFDPNSTIIRPSMRIIIGPKKQKYKKPTKHDDVIIVPEFFCEESDWDL